MKPRILIGIVLLLLVAVVVWMMRGRGDPKLEIGEDSDGRRPMLQGGENTRGVEKAREREEKSVVSGESSVGEDRDRNVPAPMAPPVERMAALGAPPVGARVKVGGMAYDLVPNQLGEFQRVYLEKGGSAEVTVRYPEGKPGDKVAVAILDGGTVGEVAGETGAHRAPLQGTALALETPEKITVVEGLLAAYRASEDEQSGATRDKELTRIDRDTLLHSIRRRRAAIQHAADSLWPATEESHGPVRKTFGLPANRAMGL